MSKILLYQGEPSVTAGQIVGASSSVRAFDAVSVTNNTASSAWISVWVVLSGESRANANRRIPEKVIAAGEDVILASLINHTIPADATIHAQVETANSLSLIISGKQ